MSDDEDGPPMLVSSENVGDAEEATLNAEMADAQVKKVPISIITGQSFHRLTGVSLLCDCSTDVECPFFIEAPTPRYHGAEALHEKQRIAA